MMKSFNAMVKAQRMKKYTMYQTDYGSAHMNPDYTISYGNIEHELPDYMEFDVNGQYVQIPIEQMGAEHVKWFYETYIDGMRVWVNIWAWSPFSYVEYAITAGDVDYKGKEPIDSDYHQEIQSAINHAINDAQMMSFSAGEWRDDEGNNYGHYGHMVYDDGIYRDEMQRSMRKHRRYLNR